MSRFGNGLGRAGVRLFGTICVATTLWAGGVLQSSAETAEEFFKGKTIRVVNPTGAGGTMDLYILLAMKYMKKYLPEDTEMVLNHRTGAGLLNGTNHMYNAAKKDGTSFGMTGTSLIFDTVTNPDAARYDPTKFQVVGRVTDLPRVIVVRADSGVESLTDTSAVKNMTHAAMVPGGPLMGAMLMVNDALGTNFRGIPGYFGGGPTFLAVEQHEVLSTSAEPANLLANKWDLVENGVVNVVAQTGITKVEGLEDVPTVLELMAPDHEMRDIALAWAGSADVGLSFVLPPEVPADRVAYLREVFEKAMNDPELLQESKDRRVPISYVSGADQAAHFEAEVASLTPRMRTWLTDSLQRNR
jgi:putative tricarboxylic transport membrane protein